MITLEGMPKRYKVLKKIAKIPTAHHFQGECSISEDFDYTAHVRIGTTDEDVAENPRKLWLQIYVGGKVIACTIDTASVTIQDSEWM